MLHKDFYSESHRSSGNGTLPAEIWLCCSLFPQNWSRGEKGAELWGSLGRNHHSLRSPRPSDHRTLAVSIGIHSMTSSLIRSYRTGFISSHPVENLPLPSWQSWATRGYEGERDTSDLLHTEKQNQDYFDDMLASPSASLEKSSSYWERSVGSHCDDTGCLARAALELYRLLFLTLLLPPAKYVTDKLLTVPKPQLSPLLKKKFSLSLFYEILYI